jgi:hypothetical protein
LVLSKTVKLLLSCVCVNSASACVQERERTCLSHDHQRMQCVQEHLTKKEKTAQLGLAQPARFREECLAVSLFLVSDRSFGCHAHPLHDRHNFKRHDTTLHNTAQNWRACNWQITAFLRWRLHVKFFLFFFFGGEKYFHF